MLYGFLADLGAAHLIALNLIFQELILVLLSSLVDLNALLGLSRGFIRKFSEESIHGGLARFLSFGVAGLLVLHYSQ